MRKKGVGKRNWFDAGLFKQMIKDHSGVFQREASASTYRSGVKQEKGFNPFNRPTWGKRKKERTTWHFNPHRAGIFHVFSEPVRFPSPEVEVWREALVCEWKLAVLLSAQANIWLWRAWARKVTQHFPLKNIHLNLLRTLACACTFVMLTDGSQNDTLPHTPDGCEKRRRTQGQDLDVMFTFSGWQAKIFALFFHVCFVWSTVLHDLLESGVSFFSTFLRRPSVCHEMEILYGCNVYEVTGWSINLGVGGGHWDKWQMRSSLKAQRESLEGQEVTVAGYWKREAPPAGSHTIKLLFILSVGEGWLVISLLETNQNTRSELWSSH